MYLVISSVSPEDSFVLLVLGDRFFRKQITSRSGTRGDVLAAIDSLLVSKKTRIERIIGVVVVVGPGFFSHVRTGVSIANAIGLGLSIPVVGVVRDQYATEAVLVRVGARLLSRKRRFTPVAPVYDKEPHITIAN